MEEKACKEEGSSAVSSEPEIIITVRPEKPETSMEKDGSLKPTPENGESRKMEEEEEDETVNNGEDCSRERVCRICHLNHDHHSILIQLGCSCKDDLGISHPHCAETWFKHKGNRQCEICGETAKNVVGFRERGHAVERNERRVAAVRSSTSSSDGVREITCCWGHKGCNLFLATLVFAFIFLWFFHLP